MTGEPSGAATMFGDFAPKLVQMTGDALFGDVWERKELSKRDRSLIAVAALIALNRPDQLRFHLANAVRNGVKEQELIELITHLAFYSGWPSAMSAMTVRRRYSRNPENSDWERRLKGRINPGRVFDLRLPFDQVAEGTARWTSAVQSIRCCAREPLSDS